MKLIIKNYDWWNYFRKFVGSTKFSFWIAFKHSTILDQFYGIGE